MIFLHKIQDFTDDELGVLLFIINKYEPSSILIDETNLQWVRVQNICKKLTMAINDIKEDKREILFSIAAKLGIQVNK